MVVHGKRVEMQMVYSCFRVCDATGIGRRSGKRHVRPHLNDLTGEKSKRARAQTVGLPRFIWFLLFLLLCSCIFISIPGSIFSVSVLVHTGVRALCIVNDSDERRNVRFCKIRGVRTWVCE